MPQSRARGPWPARTPEDLVPREVVLSMSGLDYMLGVLEGRFPQPAISGLLGYRLHRVAPGAAAFRGAAAFAHTNPMGAVHGGWYGTLLDSALGCAVMTAVPQGRWYTTLEYKVNLTRALPLGREIEAEARVSHAGRTTAVAEATIRAVDDGTLYATGSTTCLILAG
jgi:uncharacterized protein (TIGR00369 family)